eukprot:GHVS01065814.1.p1 GENE.GHVS01065814.1~~GHVS01065814.1.p1  ORF type:complete len:451 (-),score=33.49 GHVS01065814.1:213-1565(-)
MSQLFNGLQSHWASSLKLCGRFLEVPPNYFRWGFSTSTVTPARLPSASASLQKFLRAVPHARVVSLCEFSSPCGEGFCSECLVLLPLLHGSSPAVETLEPASAVEVARLVVRLQPKRLFVQLSAERLQQIGGHVWRTRKGESSLKWLRAEDFWNRWSVYPRIHGGPLSFELQLAIAASLEVQHGGEQCNVIPIDRRVSTGVRRMHEKLLYSAGATEFVGYMRYAAEAIQFWREPSPLCSLPALQARFRRVAPVAYHTLVEEKAMYMAGQILRGLECSVVSSAAYNGRRGAEGSDERESGDVNVVVCGGMEMGALEVHLLKLLRQRQEVLRSSLCVPQNSGGKKNRSWRTTLWPCADVSNEECGLEQKVLRVLPAELEKRYFGDPCCCPPVTQVPLLIFRYFLVPIVMCVVVFWVGRRLLGWISRVVFLTTSINEPVATDRFKPNPHRAIL